MYWIENKMKREKRVHIKYIFISYFSVLFLISYIAFYLFILMKYDLLLRKYCKISVQFSKFLIIKLFV